MKPGCTLLDATQAHEEHPTTFLLPSPKRLRGLRAGQYAKLCVRRAGLPFYFLGRPTDGERFWVMVEEVGAELRGTVEQADMAMTRQHGVAHGDVIFFQRCHVLMISDTGKDGGYCE